MAYAVDFAHIECFPDLMPEEFQLTRELRWRDDIEKNDRGHKEFCRAHRAKASDYTCAIQKSVIIN